MKIENKHIIITGGSLGIGKNTAKLLIEAGAKVVITGRNKERITAAANEIGAIPVVHDISDLNQIDKGVDDCLKALGNRVDVLINNAGIGDFPIIGEITKESFEKVFQTNVFGLALFTQALVPTMKSSSFPTIINIGSTASQKGFARGTVYAASKFAVRAMTQSWQAELRKENFRVCLVNPSEVTTAFNNDERVERPNEAKKLDAMDIAYTIKSVIEMDNKGFIPEVTVWATNPF